ncbi:hypothetical protein GWK47_022582 [Chionoecetes opilio]|uniref:Uncharacterized protein n=1 Tax=Chionoecetes opilio TaxID=41210 RepID=A0A8J5CDN7_CHIOP|nr:hypothetical protein GWK47_022582 [Chionoecetes opilio]
MNNLFETLYIDPFDTDNAPSKLVHFATGAVARTDLQDAMTSYVRRGERLATKFVEERLAKTRDNTTTQKSFYDPMPRQKPKTMKDMDIKIKVKSQTVALDNDVMYRRLLAMNEQKKVPFRRVMSFESSSVPMSLFRSDGSLALPNYKSDFGHKLEELLGTKIETMAGADCVIYDNNAVIRMLPFPRKEEAATFKDLASDFTAFVLQKPSQIGTPSQIHLIFDRYYKECQITGKNKSWR